MANAEKLWESFDDILAHREQWNQFRYISGRYNPDAKNIGECGTTQCIAGFRSLRDGLRPVTVNGIAAGPWFTTPDGCRITANCHAANVFELTEIESWALFGEMTNDLADFKHRIEEIIAGKWRKVAW